MLWPFFANPLTSTRFHKWCDGEAIPLRNNILLQETVQIAAAINATVFKETITHNDALQTEIYFITLQMKDENNLMNLMMMITSKVTLACHHKTLAIVKVAHARFLAIKIAGQRRRSWFIRIHSVREKKKENLKFAAADSRVVKYHYMIGENNYKLWLTLFVSD